MAMAYAFLSKYQGFEGVSFLFLSDLASPDKLLSFSFISINILPFVMTGINLLSGYVYARDMTLSEKVTIIIVALFFLIILYSAPSALLVYWTFNNIYSLIKNLIDKYLEENSSSTRSKQQ